MVVKLSRVLASSNKSTELKRALVSPTRTLVLLDNFSPLKPTGLSPKAQILQRQLIIANNYVAAAILHRYDNVAGTKLRKIGRFEKDTKFDGD